jgi:hydrogenase maturation protease
VTVCGGDRGPTVLVVGLGNPLMRDDGVGARTIELLGAAAVPAGMRTAVAPDALALPDLWRGEPDVWLVDAVVRGAPAGSCCVLSHDEILSLAQASSHAHHLALPECLRWIVHGCPEMASADFRLWGVEPATVAPGRSLDPAVEAAAARTALDILSAGNRLRGAGS